MPYWLLTSTTYGTWLPGDPRGSVTSVRDQRVGEAPRDSRREHAVYGDAFEPGNRGLRDSALRQLKGPPIRLTAEQAETVLSQVLETAKHRRWCLRAAAIMFNHFHVVLGVRDDTPARRLLIDLKAYASRSLNERYGKPASGKWWTRNGSHRRLRDPESLASAINYVLHKQPNPLVQWPHPSADQTE